MIKSIDVVIPMSGHSRRFHEKGYLGSKALLTVGNKTMIEHVVEMFDDKVCVFHFVVNSKQVKSDNKLIRYLSTLAPKTSITVIEPHEFGPVFSVMQVKEIKPTSPIIISYCDFIVDWNFKQFLDRVIDVDGAIPSFQGFHPASFGDTFYAYMDVDSKGNLLELREKKSFTKERQNEPASAGIYYFRKKSFFDFYANELLNNMPQDIKEAYVSLLYNLMVRDNLRVSVANVLRFICLGTPSDFEQYKFWYEYFELEAAEETGRKSPRPSVAIIPMAGRGSRFSDYGYKVSKPLISVQGKAMILHAMGSIPEQEKYIMLVRSEDKSKYDLDKLFLRFDKNCQTLEVKTDTSGQAATCLLAQEYISKRSEAFITSCDYRVIYNKSRWNDVMEDLSIDGAIWVTRTGSIPVKNPESFAYCKAESDGTITEIVEKKLISDSPNCDALVVGTFWYRKASDFILAANHTIENDITVNGEHYVGTSINYLISLGKKFVIFEVDKWISFGDPFELRVFEYWEDYLTKLE